MISSEEIGMIIARLAIHDEHFLADLLQSAGNAGEGLLPDDLEKLTLWAMLMRALRSSLAPYNGGRS